MGLSANFDRLILVGEDVGVMNEYKAYYQQIFAGRGRENIEIKCVPFYKNDLKHILSVLQKLVKDDDKYVFDITGGNELLLVALGMVYEQNRDKHIQIQQVDFVKSTFYDFDEDGEVVFDSLPQLSINENICIYGGEIIYGEAWEEKTYKWDLNRKFLAAVDAMWGFCNNNHRYWNTLVGQFDALTAMAKKHGKCSEDHLTFTAPKDKVDAYIEKQSRKKGFKLSEGIIRFFKNNGLITNISVKDDEISITFSDIQVMKCLTKAGQLLEIKVYITAKNLTRSNGAPLYNDALTGVLIDWDGADIDGSEKDTHNEIDVFLMHDMVPIFISCKNGIIKSDELYKLSSVADHFGGVHAKKLLFAPVISDMKDCDDLRRRAEDMGIVLIENTDNDMIKIVLENIFEN
jgi:hypothetical protein